ncbi:hypothetical protein AKJ09_01935 [Labilithrix luteola]|uniref:Uncharacterized protein n=1 Tax=Labilithrix luteola TaxID=1391654 RepID=A0A0K1PPF9_9BACT|nr:hypothetical protein AKJ09_01935 [Labilithrix luteola]
MDVEATAKHGAVGLHHKTKLARGLLISSQANVTGPRPHLLIEERRVGTSRGNVGPDANGLFGIVLRRTALVRA